MSAANRGARYGLETPSSYGRIFPQRAVPTAKFLRAIRGCRRRFPARRTQGGAWGRSEEHTSELQSLMRISYAVFCLKKKHKTADKQTQLRISHSQSHTS